VVNATGDNLLGFPVNTDGTSSSVALSTTVPVRIPDSSGSPQRTSEVDLRFNLPAGDQAKDPADFDPKDPLTYNAATSVTVYDSLGDSHVMTYYFMKDPDVANPNEWYVATAVDDVLVDITNSDGSDADPATALNTVGANKDVQATAAKMRFSDGGEFIGIASADGLMQLDRKIVTEQMGAEVLKNGSDISQQIAIDFNLDLLEANPNEPTQFASAFEVTSLEQNGLPVGRLTGIDIGPDGLVRATFSNGTSEPIVRVALVRFANEQGLTQQSGTTWKESILSGEALAGEATTGTFGDINSSSLEQANTNLTSELIDMIIAQRNFQANSRALEVNNSLNQTILNIR
jgi:flagellar hook protein FlgE